mmetsp:Transcript_92129/g.210955  ORF Transcript_92129/g.210955 Transcript_92129/m.210955 type:complete len:202 (+) Transcript_92129:379-984(+)
MHRTPRISKPRAAAVIVTFFSSAPGPGFLGPKDPHKKATKIALQHHVADAEASPACGIATKENNVANTSRAPHRNPAGVNPKGNGIQSGCTALRNGIIHTELNIAPTQTQELNKTGSGASRHIFPKIENVPLKNDDSSASASPTTVTPGATTRSARQHAATSMVVHVSPAQAALVFTTCCGPHFRAAVIPSHCWKCKEHNA